jgi:hypothetical protein
MLYSGGAAVKINQGPAASATLIVYPWVPWGKTKISKYQNSPVTATAFFLMPARLKFIISALKYLQ